MSTMMTFEALPKQLDNLFDAGSGRHRLGVHCFLGGDHPESISDSESDTVE